MERWADSYNSANGHLSNSTAQYKVYIHVHYYMYYIFMCVKNVYLYYSELYLDGNQLIAEPLVELLKLKSSKYVIDVWL